MKIHLDRIEVIRLFGFGIFFYLALGLLGTSIILWQMPASWFASNFSSHTACRLILYQPSGSVWRGSAAIGFSELDPLTGKCRLPNALTERFQWDTTCHPIQGICEGKIFFSALRKPLSFELTPDGIRLDSGEVVLPINALEALGSPWTTLRPKGNMEAHWTQLILGGSSHQDSKGQIHIVVSNLSSPINPVKPLGSYVVDINLLGEGGSWDVATINGPLLLHGAGTFIEGALHFSGQVAASPESEEALIGLLSLMGKKAGDKYKVEF